MGFIDATLQAFIGSRNERQVRALKKEIAEINALEPTFQRLSKNQLREKTTEFKHRIEKGEELDALLPEAFAAVREAAKRTLGQRHYDVQLMGGIILHRGAIAEMVTGEGKTLTATAPVYLNALSGRGVHLVTVNDYLARRDAEWMGNVYRMLGLSIGFLQSGMGPAERRQMYACDITYGTNNEFGFDYLRDNMKQDPREQVQRRLHYAIIDEVDSILIDEARTPLIISGPAQDYSGLYSKANQVCKGLEGISDKKLKEQLGKEANDKGIYEKSLGEYDFEIREKENQIILTDKGIEKIEQLLGVGHLYNAENQGWPHLMEQALRAHHLYKKDKHYVVQEGEKGAEIVIVDDFTGRLQRGRRWSDGLHQAIEAKEEISIKEESQTYATITLQNYFLLYDKISGMTGSALTEAAEFDQIYKLDVMAVPTNKPLIRDDRNDLIYGTEAEKFQASAFEVVKLYLAGRPVLLGTTSVLKSEVLSDILSHLSIRREGETLSVRIAPFRLPSPGSSRRTGDIEEIKIDASIREEQCLREEGGKLEIRLPDPALRLDDPKANPGTETWFKVRAEIVEQLAGEKGFTGVVHNVLNAKKHEQEAEIVAQAGNIGSVTIATNMAGRGTDIILGGNGEFITKQWLKQKQNTDLHSMLPEEYQESPSHLIPRDIFIEAEKRYDALVKETYEKEFKQTYDASHAKVVKLGGLAVLGTERHESRRIDNQLRGRCGRQGDPGSSQFFISLDDDLMRLFAGERVRGLMKGLGLRDGEAIQARMITKSVERAQRKVEGHHFDIRKNLKEYDDVLDLQRKTIYGLRQTILEGVSAEQAQEIDTKIRGMLNDLLKTREETNEQDAKAIVAWMKKEYDLDWVAERVQGNKRILVRDNMILGAKLALLPEGIQKRIHNTVLNVANRIAVDSIPGDDQDHWDLENVKLELKRFFRLENDLEEAPKDTAKNFEQWLESTLEEHFKHEKQKIIEGADGEAKRDRFVGISRYLFLSSLDSKWREHLRNMDQLRYGVRWEAQAQKDPKTVYKKEGRALFEHLLDDIDNEVVRALFSLRWEDEIRTDAPAGRVGGAWKNTPKIGQQAIEVAKQASQQLAQQREQEASKTPVSARPAQTETSIKKTLPKPNDPCWCGSGKKYKKCHMASDKAQVASAS